jgi:integrase
MPDKLDETIVVRKNAIRLIRRPESPTWQAHFKVEKLGTWIRKSTKTTDLDEAKEFAEDKYQEAKYLAKSGVPILSKKFKVVANIVLVDLQRKIKESGTRRGSNNDYVSAIQTYLIPFFGAYNVDRINQQVVNEFCEWRNTKVGRELSKSAQANHNAAMNVILDFAVAQGYLLPTMRPVLKNTGEASGRRPEFTEIDLKKLIEYLPGWVASATRRMSRELRELLAIYIPFVAVTGLRPGTETKFLEWRHIEIREGSKGKYLYCNVLRGKTEKKGKRMGFVMEDSCGTLLRRLADMAPELKGKSLEEVIEGSYALPVFRTRSAKVPEKPPIQFKQLLEEVGLLKCKVTGDTRSLYSLRHYAVGQAIKKGMTQQQLENYFRTSAKMISQYYNHYDSEMNVDLFAGRTGQSENSDAALLDVISAAGQIEAIEFAELVTGLAFKLALINEPATNALREDFAASLNSSSN